MEEREDGGRRRRIFRITSAGRSALSSWLSEPATGQSEPRDPGLLKLSFGDLAAPADMTALAASQATVHRERLARYESYARRGDTEPFADSLGRVLAMGTAYERVAAARVITWERDGACRDHAGVSRPPTDPAAPARSRPHPQPSRAITTGRIASYPAKPYDRDRTIDHLGDDA